MYQAVVVQTHPETIQSVKIVKAYGIWADKIKISKFIKLQGKKKKNDPIRMYPFLCCPGLMPLKFKNQLYYTNTEHMIS